jgi:hypothetical protein
VTLEELEKRVRELEHKDQIKDLHRDYLFHISNLEFDEALDCFSETIIVEIADYGKREGKKDVTKFFKDVIYKNVSQSHQGHFTGQAVISVEGQRAKGHWMFYRFLPQPSKVRWVQGRYDCEYVREDGKWKFSFLKLTRPWPEYFEEESW